MGLDSDLCKRLPNHDGMVLALVVQMPVLIQRRIVVGNDENAPSAFEMF